MMRWTAAKIWMIAFVAVLGPSKWAGAYFVGAPVDLDKMGQMADLIVKARVVANAPIADDAFKAQQGFAVVDTKLEMISLIKGDTGGKAIDFHHYALDPASQMWMYEPQHYELEMGKSYIVFASKTPVTGVFRQLWQEPKILSDLGVLRTVDDHPVQGGIKEIYWSELLALTQSTRSEDVIYGLEQMDEMSRGDRMAVQVFDRKDVAEAIRPLLGSKDEKILEAAISVAGSRNPFMDSQNAMYWLATVGPGHLLGLATLDRKFDNLAGRELWHELARLVDGERSVKLRAMALRALGRTNVAELPANLHRWAEDQEPLVRQAAVVLLADVPGDESQKSIAAAAKDSSSEVRLGAAQAIGFGQITALVPLLGELLKDSSPQVRDSAAMSLLSFPNSVSGDLLRANIQDPEYRSLFVNALAADDPQPYLADLEEVIARHESPTRYWGGRIPQGDSWEILFNYVKSRPQAEFTSGKLNQAMDGLEKLPWDQWGSSEPRDLYELYLRHGLEERAKALRALCEKEVRFDIDYYFNQVDQSLKITGG